MRVSDPQEISFCVELNVSADEPTQETQHNIVLVRGTRIAQLNTEPGAVHSNASPPQACQHVRDHFASRIAVLWEVRIAHRHQDVMPVTKATIEVEARPLHALYILGLVGRVAGATELPLVGGVNDHADHIRRSPGLSPMGPVHATVCLRIILVAASGWLCVHARWNRPGGSEG